jgi:hypothetical protein
MELKTITFVKADYIFDIDGREYNLTVIADSKGKTDGSTTISHRNNIIYHGPALQGPVGKLEAIAMFHIIEFMK